jgi:putative redox protein
MAIHARSLNNFQVEIKTATHTILADEPVEAGGDDSGPNPYELLLSSLAACKIITVQMYARRKGWELTGIELNMATHKIHAVDCTACESDPKAKIDVIETQIKFLGDLNAEQVDRLKQISEKCPVHRTLTSETKIYTSLMN